MWLPQSVLTKGLKLVVKQMRQRINDKDDCPNLVLVSFKTMERAERSNRASGPHVSPTIERARDPFEVEARQQKRRASEHGLQRLRHVNGALAGDVEWKASEASFVDKALKRLFLSQKSDSRSIQVTVTAKRVESVPSVWRCEFTTRDPITILNVCMINIVCVSGPDPLIEFRFAIMPVLTRLITNSLVDEFCKRLGKREDRDALMKAMERDWGQWHEQDDLYTPMHGGPVLIQRVRDHRVLSKYGNDVEVAAVTVPHEWTQAASVGAKPLDFSRDKEWIESGFQNARATLQYSSPVELHVTFNDMGHAVKCVAIIKPQELEEALDAYTQ